MRFTVSAIFVFATSFALVAAQDLGGIPSCAIPCFATAVSGSGCSLTDTRCQCTTGRESITNSLLTCTPSRCSADELPKIASAVQTLCGAAGVTITDVPSAVPTSLAPAVSSGLSAITGTASRPASGTGSAAPAASTGAAVGNVVVGYSAAVAMGLVGVLAL